MDFRGISGIWCFNCVSTCFWDFGGFDVVWGLWFGILILGWVIGLVCARILAGFSVFGGYCLGRSFLVLVVCGFGLVFCLVGFGIWQFCVFGNLRFW